ncbi:hypothetical protein EV183_003045 [Coemansia sp. RSA 2336]|nr:hypothetical protein EV183_003045 [Coemansia sp. RSA 2336]
MARSKISVIAAAWFLAATQVAAGPIATAGDIEGDTAAATSELASLGGLLQALGAGVIGNGALLYPTQATPHQREESEILASDTATRVFKKVKSILKDGGINEDDNGDDESKSVTYLIKPAMIFHKEELPPPNPLAGNVLPLPGGALMYTPTPTGASPNEPTSGPAASIKAAYGNLFAASPYTPSYTLNKPHAAVIVEEVTDMISLKSSLQRLEDQGEDVDDDSDDDEDDFGRKRRNHKAMKIVSLETIESTSTFVNPFTRADFPFGMMTPPQASPAPTSSSSSSRKTIRKVISKTTEPIRASMGKDGGITVVNNAAPSTSQGTTIVIPAASLQSTASSESHSETHSAESSKSEEPKSEESKSQESSKSEDKDDLKANEVTRMAHKTSAHSISTHVKGLRRDATAIASNFDPLGATESSASAMSSLDSMASETAASATPTATVGSLVPASPMSASAHPETASALSESTTSGPARRKMRIVRVYEVKKSGTHAATMQTTSAATMQKRDFMPIYDAPTAAEPVHVSNWERVIRDEAEDNDSDDDETTVDVDESASESDLALSDMASDMATDDAEVETVEEKAKEEPAHNTSSKSLSIETIGGVPASQTDMAKDEPMSVASSSSSSSSVASEKSEKSSSDDSDSDSDDASEDGDSDSDDASEDARDSDEDDELDYEFETEAGVNSDGEEVEFVTQLVPDSARKNVNETPSVVVMASIDEEFEEDYVTDSAKPNDDAVHVQRIAADDDDDSPVVRGAEPTPDIDVVKQSQNRAINIGMGNLRRHA